MFALHCPVLIQPREELLEDKCYAHFRRFENSQWVGQYLAEVQRMISFKKSYSLFRCFPHIPGTGYNDEFHDTRDNQTSLRLGTFKWLVDIRSSYLVYQSSDNYYLEPYLPSRFARQFGYDQVYVGNPNP